MAEAMNILIPGALAFIMFGLGLELTVADFARFAQMPKPVLVGLLGHTLILPSVALAMIVLFDVPTAFALGLMVVAACPGGAVSNLWTYLARGDVALAVTLTALSAAVAVVWVPVLLNLTLQYFAAESVSIRLPLGDTMMHIAVLTVIPVSAGMALHRYLGGVTARLQRAVKALSVLFLVLAVVGILVRGRHELPTMLATAGLPVLAYNVVVMAAGLMLARLFRLTARQAITIPMEVGIQNVIMAATLATSPQFLGRPEAGLVPSVYGFTMCLVATGFIVLTRLSPGVLGPQGRALMAAAPAR